MPGGVLLKLMPFIDAFSRLTSPYDLNPYNLDPLREILDAHIDFERLRAQKDIPLFVTATCVTTGKAEVFSGQKISADAVLASACLPFIRQAVEIEGKPYWDGGFTGNPALWPLFYDKTPDDLLIVHINPLKRPGTPKSAGDIMRHKYDRQTQCLRQLADKFVKRRSADRVQPRRRLVEKQHIRVKRERTGQTCPLLHPARKL